MTAQRRTHLTLGADRRRRSGARLDPHSVLITPEPCILSNPLEAHESLIPEHRQDMREEVIERLWMRYPEVRQRVGADRDASADQA